MTHDAQVSAQETPWWLRPGTETCPHCLRSYQLEVGYRCLACDGPACPVCMVTVEGKLSEVCPDCRREEESL